MPFEVPSFSPEDFGKAAADYAGFRKGFPPSFFERLTKEGLGKPGQRILDLGTGTGTLALGFARQGASTVGLDLSAPLLAQARRLAEKDGLAAEFIEGRAEAIPLPDASVDAVTAGQCWHWFDGPAAARECLRVLRPGGLLAIAHWSYLALPGNPAEASEALILSLNPSWNMAGSDGVYENWRNHLGPAGFEGLRSFRYEEDSPYTHEEWRGRMRSCNGVLALRDPERIAAFDRELARVLGERFPREPMLLPHRAFALLGRKPCS